MTTTAPTTTKTCSTCKQDKPLDDFALRSKTGERRQAKCRACTKEYNQKYHAANKSEINPRSHATAKSQRTELAALAEAARAAATCAGCGAGHEADIILLPPTDLTNGRNLSDIIRAGWAADRFTDLLNATLATTEGAMCRRCVGRLNGIRAHNGDAPTLVA